jgi:hypothetical protein
MDYLIGSVVTFTTIVIISFLIRRYSVSRIKYETTYSQSYVHSMLSPLYTFVNIFEDEKIVSQATIHNDSLYTQVIITKNKAYWIKDNTFIVAPITEEGEIDKEAAQAVDTMAMNKVQLEEMALIVEELTRGKGYDSRSTGQS